MPDITITVSIATLNRLKADFTEVYDYENSKKPNESEATFTKRMIIQLIKAKVRGIERELNVKSASNAHDTNYQEPDID